MVHDAGGGGGSTSRWTNWNDKDVPTIWGYLGYLNLDPMWTHSTGWTKTHELASANLWRLRDFRAKLVTAWPPEKSDAAAIYVAKLDELIANVEAVFDAALANKASASDMALSLGLAKGKLKPLYDEYQANSSRQAAYDSELAAKKQELSDRPLDTWKRSHPNPAVATRQQEITAEARGIMWGVSTDLNSAHSRMVQPPPYVPPRGDRVYSEGDDGSYEGGGGLVPPFIPAPVPSFGNGQTQPPPNGGPILSGAVPLPAATLPSGGLSPIGGTPVAPGLPGSPGHMPGLPIPPGGVIGGPRAPMGGVAGVPGAIIGGRPNPVGGVIGASGAVRGGAAMPGRTVNPVGGIIGGSSGGLPPGVGARTPQRSSSDTAHQDWDPNNPWEVAEGVAPVLEAPAEWGPIDPGPTIGGRR